MAVEKELLKGIELLKEGKEEGFNILYSHTYNYVYGRAKVIMKQEEDALDLTQETFIQAYKGIQQLEDVNNIYAWLGGITYRQGMKMFRKRREVLVGEDAEGIFEDIEEDDNDHHPEASADKKMTSDIMKSMIEELPELQKATIMAYYYDNMKIDDIAEVFACSSNTVKSRLNYAKKFLKTKVEEHEKENRYKLHSLTPAVFLLAYKSLFTEKEYVLVAETAETIYQRICGEIHASSTLSITSETVKEETASMINTAVKTTENIVSTADGASMASAINSAGTMAAKAGLSLGAKLLIGAASVLMVGLGGVGIATATGNLDLKGAFQQEVVTDDHENETGEENQAGFEGTEKQEDAQKETEMLEAEISHKSYGEIVEFMHASEYKVESAVYSEEAANLMHKLTYTMMLDEGQAFDMTMLTEEQRQKFNYTLLNEGFGYGFIPQVTEIVEGAPGGVLFETEVLNSYLSAFYEDGNVGASSDNLLLQYEDYTVYRGSDAGEWHTFTDYSMYQYEDYLLLQAPCYYVDIEGIYEVELYTVSVLFKITENELYPVQMLHVNTKLDDTAIDKSQLDETIVLEDISFGAGIYWGPSDYYGGGYSIEISNEKKYENYMTFDLMIWITNNNGPFDGWIDCKVIYCHDVVLQGNTAKFECDKEIYFDDQVKYYNGGEGEERENGFYGELIAQDGGKTLILTYGVKNDTDGWTLNRSTEPLTFGANGHAY